MPPTEPKRLQALNRIAEILGEIKYGDDYFSTPYQVAKVLLDHEKARHGNLYMIFPESEGEIVLSAMPDQYDETFHGSIYGIVFDRDDLTAKLEKAIRDIRYAIDQDAITKSGTTLGTICIQVRFDEPPKIEIFEDFGFFDQRVRIHVTGNIGE